MRTSVLLPIVVVAALVTGCVTHATRSVMRTTGGVAPRTHAEAVCQSLGYALAQLPPTKDAMAARNARRAWRWWAGNASSEGSGFAAYSVTQPWRAFWVRPRADGGWDQLAITEFWANSGWFDATSIRTYWSRWVVNAGTFGPDGTERWPSSEVRADADSLISVIWRVQRSEGKS